MKTPWEADPSPEPYAQQVLEGWIDDDTPVAVVSKVFDASSTGLETTPGYRETSLFDIKSGTKVWTSKEDFAAGTEIPSPLAMEKSPGFFPVDVEAGVVVGTQNSPAQSVEDPTTIRALSATDGKQKWSTQIPWDSHINYGAGAAVVIISDYGDSRISRINLPDGSATKLPDFGSSPNDLRALSENLYESGSSVGIVSPPRWVGDAWLDKASDTLAIRNDQDGGYEITSLSKPGAALWTLTQAKINDAGIPSGVFAEAVNGLGIHTSSGVAIVDPKTGKQFGIVGTEDLELEGFTRIGTTAVVGCPEKASYYQRAPESGVQIQLFALPTEPSVLVAGDIPQFVAIGSSPDPSKSSTTTTLFDPADTTSVTCGAFAKMTPDDQIAVLESKGVSGSDVALDDSAAMADVASVISSNCLHSTDDTLLDDVIR